MTFLEGIDEAAAAEAGGLPTNNLASLVSKGLDEGLSATQMLSDLQAANMGVRRGDFLALVRQVKAANASSDAWAQLAMDQVPGEADAVTWYGGATDTYLYRVRMYIREGGPGGLGLYEGNFDILSDSLITPDEALSRAKDIWDANEQDDDYANRQLWGQALGGLYHQTVGP